ncbi:MAG: TIGR02186 family protein [Pseudomonadota bacterium]
MRTLLAALLFVFVMVGGAAPQADDRVVAGLSQHNVSLTTSFTGSQLFVYGAIDADRSGSSLDVIVAITGPDERVQVRKKERQFGIWINGQAVEIDEAPSFYAVATTGPFREVLSWTEDERHRIGLDSVIRLIDAPDWLNVSDREAYRSAIARIREEQGLYSVQEGTVKVIDETLFETRIKLPANLVEGDYQARIFLTQSGEVLDVFEDKVEVRRAGIGRWIYSSAQDWPALYGIVSILVALAAGWLASAFFRTFFPN